MNTSNNNKVNTLDLPNEILLFIFNKLKTIDVLYSLVDVNERFNRLIFNSLHIRNLDMTNMVMKSYFNRNFSMDKNVILRISEKILPRISHQLNELIVERYSIEYILFPFNYPQLYSLSLINFQEKILFQYLTSDSLLHNLLTQQITDLNVDISYNSKSEVSKTLSNIFTLILSIISFYKLSSISCVSSTLTKLNINVERFDDCLYLLQHLKSLLILIIDVKKIMIRGRNNNNNEKLPKLKYFSLTSIMFTDHYDDQIIPLLRRMINLKELTLFLAISKSYSTYIDELCVINCIPQKNKQYLPILIIFPHLILLDLYKIHVDYAEQLLFDKNIHLPCLLDLCIKYKLLEIITNNFTNNPIRDYCAKIKKLHIDKFIPPKNFHEYFPLL
ncbi:unnamed protein product [Rotaria sordida]|uniref:F-box domain-containing protein n=1 Tax=Rotaria sordida TaxID=392033 RepID=A0A815M5A5_9BILA|nr:unnamed protein product [Rotaria sordida]CAF1418333.1 unnamed protein product [Rotaria sordida]CAF1629459.1 unnamed protein product [Rotaria sordida]CAF1629465.1 unnamed protein product [Rotaria sordida]